MSAEQLTVVLLARYSPKNEKGERGAKLGADDRKANSCDVQIDDLRRHAEANGYIIDDSLIFRDDAKSGKNLNRPGLIAALAACVVSLDPLIELPRKRRRILICRDTSRLAANLFDAFFIVRQVVRGGVLFETIRSGRFDANDPQKVGWFGMEAVMAEVQRMVWAAQTKDKSRRYQNKDSRRMSAIPPYGKCPDPLDDARWVDDPDEQAAITAIRRWTAVGVSQREICRRLNDRGYTCRGRPWGHKIIGRILGR